MKSRLRFTTVSLHVLTVLALAGLTHAQTVSHHEYFVTDLGTLGGAYSYAYGLNNAGMVAGGSATSSQSGGLAQTAFLWYRGQLLDLGTLGGPACPACNSEAGGPNARGEAAVISETGTPDPNNEDFCGFGTHLQCLGASWQEGVLTHLPTLPGGNNDQTYWVNNLGQLVGFSENAIQDPTCSQATPYQKFRFEAVIWGPNGRIRKLQPLPGDTVAFGFGINDNGEAIGASGLCSNTAFPPFTNGPRAPHAVLWNRDGLPQYLGSLVNGSAIDIATSINNRGEVVGGSQSSNGAPHAFLWTRNLGMQDLGMLSGDVGSIAPCCHTINERGQVVGFSFPGPLGSGRAFLWENGTMTDLNTLIPAGSPWYLLQALSINDAGQIAGYGTINHEVHAFLATPVAVGPR